MAQLRWGARQSLDAMYADLADIIDLATDDPATVRKLARRITNRLRDEVEPKLQRESAAPTMEDRIARLEKIIKRMTDSDEALAQIM